MNFFDQLVIPASENHILLVKYMLTISLLLFIPYICMLLGATFISTRYNKKGKLEGNPLYLRFAKDVMEKLSITRNAEFALGTIPLLSALFAYAQLLYTAKTISLGMLTLSAVLFIISFVFIYKYRNTFRLKGIISALKRTSGDKLPAQDEESSEEVKEFEEEIAGTNSSSGTYGKYILLTAVYLFTATMALAASPDKWGEVGNILQVIFSWQSLFSFLAFLSLAGIVSGSAIMFYFFSWDGGLKNMTEEYAQLVRTVAGKLSIASGILFPLMLIISYAYTPAVSQSPSVFYFMVALLIISLILGGSVYSMFKNSDTGAATTVFVLVFLLITFNILKDQAVLGNALFENTREITKIAAEYQKEARSKTMQSSGVDVAAIFTQKCSACHKFDQKLVGPAYDQVIPKYNGDTKKLGEYIFNPTKIDPAFPPMPNQGLKKKEANALAQWLIDQVGKK